jgi:hypothetical protein
MWSRTRCVKPACFSTGFVSRLPSQVDLFKFEEQPPPEFFKLLGTDEDTRVETAAQLLEKLEEFGKRGAAAAKAVEKEKEKKELKRKLDELQPKKEDDDSDEQ